MKTTRRWGGGKRRFDEKEIVAELRWHEREITCGHIARLDWEDAMEYPIYALLVAAIVTIALGPLLIPLLKRLKFGQTERDDGPQSHLKKTGTPTMGGIMFIIGILVGTLAFSLNATELALPRTACDGRVRARRVPG